jgi:hypothetical protein
LVPADQRRPGAGGVEPPQGPCSHPIRPSRSWQPARWAAVAAPSTLASAARAGPSPVSGPRSADGLVHSLVAGHGRPAARLGSSTERARSASIAAASGADAGPLEVVAAAASDPASSSAQATRRLAAPTATASHLDTDTVPSSHPTQASRSPAAEDAWRWDAGCRQGRSAASSSRSASTSSLCWP